MSWITESDSHRDPPHIGTPVGKVFLFQLLFVSGTTPSPTRSKQLEPGRPKADPGHFPAGTRPEQQEALCRNSSYQEHSR